MLLCLGVMIYLYIGFPESSASLLLLYTNLGLLFLKAVVSDILFKRAYR